MFNKGIDTLTILNVNKVEKKSQKKLLAPDVCQQKINKRGGSK